jgi:hypothetical protein
MTDLISRETSRHKAEHIRFVGKNDVGMGIQQRADQGTAALHVTDEHTARLKILKQRGVPLARMIGEPIPPRRVDGTVGIAVKKRRTPATFHEVTTPIRVAKGNPKLFKCASHEELFPFPVSKQD